MTPAGVVDKAAMAQSLLSGRLRAMVRLTWTKSGVTSATG